MAMSLNAHIDSARLLLLHILQLYPSNDTCDCACFWSHWRYFEICGLFLSSLFPKNHKRFTIADLLFLDIDGQKHLVVMPTCSSCLFSFPTNGFQVIKYPCSDETVPTPIILRSSELRPRTASTLAVPLLYIFGLELIPSYGATSDILLIMNSEIFQLPIASEIVNVFNYVVVDLLIVSFALYVTGILAGCINSHALAHDSQLNLVPFDIPLIGGGLITFRGKRRGLLIFLRFSTLLAASASAFGVEGRTEIPIISQSAVLRAPGFQRPINKQEVSRVQKGFSCGTWEGKIFYFGTMADDRCYPNVRQYSIIKSVSEERSIQAEAFNCTESYSCEGPKPTSTYRCAKADIVCQGVPRKSGCANAKGLETDVDGKQKCKAIIFPDDGKHVIGCLEGVLQSESSATLASCWKYVMKPEDARWWNETYPRFTLFNARAVYVSAHGIERRQTVQLPGDPLPVTSVTIWWILSVSWLVLVCVSLGIGWIALKSKSLRPRLHDTKSLLEMLNAPDYTYMNGEGQA